MTPRPPARTARQAAEEPEGMDDTHLPLVHADDELPPTEARQGAMALYNRCRAAAALEAEDLA